MLFTFIYKKLCTIVLEGIIKIRLLYNVKYTIYDIYMHDFNCLYRLFPSRVIHVNAGVSVATQRSGVAPLGDMECCN